MTEVQESIQRALEQKEYELPELIEQIHEETGLDDEEVAKEIWRLLDSRQIRVTSDRKMATLSRKTEVD